MKTFFLLLALFSSLGITALAQEKTSTKQLLKEYSGQVQIPDDLYAAYADFVKALESHDASTVQKLCLPHSVSFTQEPRPAESREYGSNINLPFLRNGFQKHLLVIRRDSEETFLLRTASSYMYFVNTQSGEWKLYKYGDKPIE